MEANESSGLTNSYSSSYPSHHHHNHHHPNHQSPPQQPPPPSSLTYNEPNQPSGSNGVASADGGGAALFPPSVAGKAPSVDPQRRKRGRPRKYSTPEAAAAAKRAAVPAAVKRVERQFQAFGGGGGSGGGGGGFLSSSGSSKKSNFASFGGQGFTPHVINVAAGEDVGQRILLFMQQAKRELCILSASGSIASAALRQPATSGGSIAYQGRFDIVSLTGSYVRSDQGGKAGGLSACLSSENGQIVGGGVCGPLIAAGPVELPRKRNLSDQMFIGMSILKSFGMLVKLEKFFWSSCMTTSLEDNLKNYFDLILSKLY